MEWILKQLNNYFSCELSKTTPEIFPVSLMHKMVDLHKTDQLK